MLLVRGTAPARADRVALAALVTAVSWWVATNVAGLLGQLVVGVGFLVAVLVVLPWATDGLRHAPRWVLPALVVAVIVLLVLAAVVDPTPGLGRAIGVGSDRADALDVTVTRLVHGLYPYDATTYLGNPLSPLPGSMLLAAPFVLVTGYAATQNLVWTLVLLPVLNGGRRLRPEPTLLWALIVLGAPEVLREFVVGDDLVVSAIPAVAAVAWTLRVATGRRPAVLVVAAAVLGVVTCTRPHLALVVVIAVAAVAVRAGWRRAAVVGMIASLTWVLLIVPFLLGGVGRFSPLHVAAKVTGDRTMTLGIVVIALVALVVLVGALAVVRPASPAAVGWFCAAVLAAPTVLSVLHGKLTGTGWDVTLGAAAVPFAAWAVAARTVGDGGSFAEHEPGAR